MPNPWTAERIAIVTARKAEPIKAIARVVNLAPQTVRKKMIELGLLRHPTARVVNPGLSPVQFPRFQDVAHPDADRCIGRKPGRQLTYSPMTSAGALCVGG